MRAWLPRFVHPNVTLTNGDEFAKIKSVDAGGLRDLVARRAWDYHMPSPAFRERIRRMEKRVGKARPAFGPDPRLQLFRWSDRPSWENEGACRLEWVRLATLDEEWDLCPSDEWVGDELFHNRPFQMEYKCVPPPCSGLSDITRKLIIVWRKLNMVQTSSELSPSPARRKGMRNLNDY